MKAAAMSHQSGPDAVRTREALRLGDPESDTSTFHEISPLADPRWSAFIDAYPESSIFHSPGWLRSLQDTYGYKPVAFVDAAPGKLFTNAQVMCEIDSWLTGRRLVGLPFSDHSALLCTDQHNRVVYSELKRRVEAGDFHHFEVRPVGVQHFAAYGLGESAEFYLHRIRLNTDPGVVFHHFHKDSVQRKIRRSEREGLTYADGRNEELIRAFYRLLLLTHSRHHTPTQPLAWFRNLVSNLGPAINIRIASKNGEAVAGLITLVHKRTMTYKYGASDTRYHHLGSVAFLFWRAIQDAVGTGMLEFDMGRTNIGDMGLVNFKEHWGARREQLFYWRYPIPTVTRGNRLGTALSRALLAVAPSPLLRAAGAVLYRHVG